LNTTVSLPRHANGGRPYEPFCDVETQTGAESAKAIRTRQSDLRPRYPPSA
jgi:hypothetical protein